MSKIASVKNVLLSGLVTNNLLVDVCGLGNQVSKPSDKRVATLFLLLPSL